MSQNSGQNSKPFWRLRVGKGSFVHHPSNGEGLRDIQHSISRILDKNFYVWFIMTLYCKTRQILLQIATAILLQNASGFLLQNAAVITKCDIYYKLRQYTHLLFHLNSPVNVL